MNPWGERVDVEVVVPVRDGHRVLQEIVWRLHHHLSLHLDATWRITIVVEASTDATATIADGLAESLSDVAVLHLEQPGRGRALKAGSAAADAQVVVYLDVALATDPAAIAPLVAPLLAGHTDVAVGTTSGPGPGPDRGIRARACDALVRTALAATFTDSRCGSKAITREAAALLLPLVQDDDGFFDTELLVLAERSGLRIRGVPVDIPPGTEPPGSAAGDLKGAWRLLTAPGRNRAALGVLPKQPR